MRLAENRADADYIFEADSLAATEMLAAYLARQSRPGTVIALDGDLGAGKTAFSQLFARHLQVKDTVNSPTFTLIKEYEGRLPLYHMDVYRLSLDEADELGLDEYFYGEGVSLVEWASLIEEILPPEMLEIYIEADFAASRKFYLMSHGHPYDAWVQSLKENGVMLHE